MSPDTCNDQLTVATTHCPTWIFYVLFCSIVLSNGLCCYSVFCVVWLVGFSDIWACHVYCKGDTCPVYVKVKVLLWNVNGLSRAKMESEYFLSNIVVNDIVFLYESWTSSNSKNDLSGYVCHHIYRNVQHRNARRCSGGVVLYYKDSIKYGIEIIKT